MWGLERKGVGIMIGILLRKSILHLTAQCQFKAKPCLNLVLLLAFMGIVVSQRQSPVALASVEEHSVGL